MYASTLMGKPRLEDALVLDAEGRYPHYMHEYQNNGFTKIAFRN
jgi:hypothetical protein